MTPRERLTSHDEQLIRRTFSEQSWPVPLLLAEIDALRAEAASPSLRSALEEIPLGTMPKPGLASVAGWNRYDTDDEHVLHLFESHATGQSESWDIRIPRAALAATPEAPGLDVERLARMRDLVEEWLAAERLLDTMNVDDGPAHQDAWDAVHFTREQLAREYAAAEPASDSGEEGGRP